LAILEKQFHSRLKSAAAALVKKECDQVEAQIKEFFGARADTDFILWLDTFYKTFSDEVKKDFGPVLQEYAKVVHQEAGRIVGDTPALTDEMAGFIRDYLDTYALRHTGSSLGQLQGLVNATDPEELYQVLTDRIQQWRDRRGDKIADDESIRVANAVARETWRTMGVTKLKWVTQGSAACPFCKKLAGRVVGIQRPFIASDEVLKGQDQEGNWMSIKGKKNHPPIHRGCVCAIVPITETRTRFAPVGPNDFVHHRDRLPDHLRPFITPLTAAEYQENMIQTYLAESGLAGYGLTPDNELVSVFSIPGAAQGRMAVDQAVKNGAKHLDCFDTILVSFYNEFGFEVTGRVEWDDQYAPPGWDYDQFGKPDIVSMEKKKKKRSQDPFAYKKSPNWFKPGPDYVPNKGTKAFQDLADEFVEVVFGKDTLEKLKKE
jgi:hypothetical protein